MIYNFEVEGFKGFEEKISLDLSHRKNYEFNPECIKDGVVNKSIIYGANGIGKSNLGVAIFDIVSHLTEHFVSKKGYDFYLNARNKTGYAKFKYSFKFDNHNIIYEYWKKGINEIARETLIFDSDIVAEIKRDVDSIANFSLPGTETLKTDLSESKISIINYIKNNAVLSDGVKKDIFLKFIKFVDGMLYFRSIEENSFIGLEDSVSSIPDDILKRGNISDFQSFLSLAGIDYNLCVSKSRNGGDDIGVDFGDGKIIPFFSIASTGTKALYLFYFWMQRIRCDGAVSFVFIDEFDAFYHHELSLFIVKKMKDAQAQTIMTTHNTSVMSNDLLRPDCYFVMDKTGISPLSDKTDKDLRQAHNIEKMYKAGTFSSSVVKNHG